MGTKRKKKNNTESALAAPVAAAESVAAPSETLWPEDLPRSRTIVLAAVALVVVSALLAGLGQSDLFIRCKMAVAALMGLQNPIYIAHLPGMPPTSWDVAGVLLGTTLLFCTGILHPALGLASLGLLRPWLDGYTYPGDNAYFLWGLLFLYTLWAVRLLLRGGDVRHFWLLALLGAYLAAMAIAGVLGIQYYRSYQQTLYWVGYWLAFLLAVNTVRGRGAAGGLFAGLMLATFAQAYFSVLHFRYLLPYLRKMLLEYPQLRMQFFGDDKFTPELINRFNMNRAFGTMLFPNALAAFLILAIPAACVGAAILWRMTYLEWRSGRTRLDRTAYQTGALAATLVHFLAAVVLAVAFIFPKVYDTAATHPDSEYYWAIIDALLVAFFPALAVAASFLFRGTRFSLAMLGATGLTGVFLAALAALWCTYSRGGMLSLFAGVAVFVALALWLRLGATLPGMRRWASAAVCIGCIAGAGLVLQGQKVLPGHTAPAAAPATATTPAISPITQLPEESRIMRERGFDLSARDMMNTASMGLRVGYWRVGWSMFMNNFLHGVGPGNFGLAYPTYQYLGAGDVREAHNGYLQAFCETGVAGGILLCMFWTAVLLTGLSLVRADGWSATGLFRLALFAGLLAFLGQSFLDINFSHQSLMFFAMVYAGLMLAWPAARPEAEDAAPAPAPKPFKYRILALPLLLLGAVAAGMSARMYMQQLGLSRISVLNVARTDMYEQRFATAKYLLEDVGYYAADRTKPQPKISIANLVSLISNSDILSRMGAIYAPIPGEPRKSRRLKAGETIPPEGMLVVGHPYYSFNRAVDASVEALDEMAFLDSGFPYNPDLAGTMAEWYMMIAIELRSQEHSEQRRVSKTEAERWANEMVKRSPQHADSYFRFAQLQWKMAYISKGKEQLDYGQQAIDSAEKALSLAPQSPSHWGMLSVMLGQYIDLLKAAGDLDKADRLAIRLNEVDLHFTHLVTERGRLGLPS